MNNKGISHIGHSTLYLDKTRVFYEDVLGFRSVRSDTLRSFWRTDPHFDEVSRRSYDYSFIAFAN